MAQEKGFEFIVITNQGGVSKGIYNKNDVHLVHGHMLTQFKKAALTVLEIYYCPHHSDLEQCICRKPDSLMLEKAIARFNIDKSLSFMIGDSQRDVEAATKVGIKSFKIEPNTKLNQLENYLFWWDILKILH